MEMKPISCCLFAAMLGCAVGSAAADPKSEYERRAAERYVALFQSLDLDSDGTVSREEAQGDLNFRPSFDDMDINRDGIVTLAELQRYIEQNYGVRLEVRR
jgi:Ca2+-binding EF-hand superfamily protein